MASQGEDPNQDQNRSWKSDSDTEEDLPGNPKSKDDNKFRGLLSKLIITGECFLGLDQDLESDGFHSARNNSSI